MASAPNESPKPTRPRSVTFISAGVLLLGLVDIYRAVVLFQQVDIQLELGVSVDPRLRMVIALIWAAVFIALAIALWIRMEWTRILVPASLLLYAIYSVALVALFAGSEYARDSQYVTVLFYGIVIAYTAWALNRGAARQYFDLGEDGQESKSDQRE